MKQTDYFLSQLFRPSEAVNFGLADVVLAMTVSAILCFMLAGAYRETHRGTSYSQSFLLTLFLMGTSTSVVMMIIGSNIARAFSLVGALSIIRFRTAVKDPRDTGFLFTAIVAGMGCGTQFYMPAIALTVFVSVLVTALYHFDYGSKQRLDMILKITFSREGETDSQKAIESVLKKQFKRYTLINRLLDFGDGLATNVYVTQPAKKTKKDELELMLKEIGGVSSISFFETDQNSNI
ncbi:MAG: DUF4956 domain-containing protein [bacterium]